MEQKAFFIRHPRISDELITTNPNGQWLSFQIVKMITLSKTDYTNFVTDMLADRQFIEDWFHLCQSSSKQTLKCILVQCKGQQSILVVPENCFVGWAALLPE